MRLPHGWVLWRHGIGFGDFTEERLHFARRQKGDQHPAQRLAHIGPNMGYLAWRQQRIARMQSVPFAANLQNKFPFKGVKPFILVMMQVTRWTPFGVKCVFYYEQAIAVLGHHFEGDLTNAQATMLTKTIFASRNVQGLRLVHRTIYRYCHVKFLCFMDEDDKGLMVG
jgi:hypothetical protein